MVIEHRERVVEIVSLRDYFAAKAMQGLVSNSVDIKNGFGAPTLTKNAYIIADAMIKAREDVKE